jgi:hypothetical protein
MTEYGDPYPLAVSDKSRDRWDETYSVVRVDDGVNIAEGFEDLGALIDVGRKPGVVLVEITVKHIRVDRNIDEQGLWSRKG